jgi:cell division protease FtsH
MVYAENEGEIFLGRSITKTTNVSEDTMRKVDSEIRRIIDEQYAVARRILEDNRDKVEVMTAALLDWETIDADQIDDICSGRPPRPPKERSGGTGGTGGVLRRVVVAQDTGAAIIGSPRADLYWGTGAAAGQAAGLMKHPGRLWLLSPRP